LASWLRASFISLISRERAPNPMVRNIQQKQNGIARSANGEVRGPNG